MTEKLFFLVEQLRIRLVLWLSSVNRNKKNTSSPAFWAKLSEGEIDEKDCVGECRERMYHDYYPRTARFIRTLLRCCRHPSLLFRMLCAYLFIGQKKNFCGTFMENSKSFSPIQLRFRLSQNYSNQEKLHLQFFFLISHTICLRIARYLRLQ